MGGSGEEKAGRRGLFGKKARRGTDLFEKKTCGGTELFAKKKESSAKAK